MEKYNVDIFTGSIVQCRPFIITKTLLVYFLQTVTYMLDILTESHISLTLYATSICNEIIALQERELPVTRCTQDLWEHHRSSPALMAMVSNVKLSGFDFGTVKPNNDVVDM